MLFYPSSCDCDSITSIVIPDSIRTIYGYLGSGAFSYAKNLKTVTIGNGLESCGGNAFPSSITAVYIHDLDAWCRVQFGLHFNTTHSINGGGFQSSNPLCGGGQLICNGELVTEVNIPDDVIDISCPFYRYTYLKKVTIPEGVKGIGLYSFVGCTSLTSVNIPSSVESISNLAFSGCTGLTEVNFTESYPYHYTNISDYAFQGCSSLKSVLIPRSVNVIGERSFYCDTIYGYKDTEAEKYANKYEIPFVEVEEPVRLIFSIANEEATVTELVGKPEEIEIPSVYNGYPVTKIGEKAFYDKKSLKRVIIPDSIVDISASAFEGCEMLTEVTIPGSVKKIYGSAFRLCGGLTNVNIESGVQYISSRAFEYCSGLTNITLPDTLTEIQWYAFSSCSNLTSVTLPDSNCLISPEAFYRCINLKSITIPAKITSIGSHAFGYNGNGYTYLKVPYFTVCGYNETEAERYAKDNMFSFVSLGDVPSDSILGDVNGDGEADTLDATLIQRYVTFVKVPYSDEVMMCGDTDGDGVLTVMDATFIQRYSTRIKVPYPIGEIKTA